MGGGDKAFMLLAGRPLLEHVVERLGDQVVAWVVVSSGEVEGFRSRGLRVLQDERPGRQGPLAGVEAALKHCATPWLLTVAVDLPFLPRNLVAMLLAAATDGVPVVATDAEGRAHPVVALWPVGLLPQLSQALDAGERSLNLFLERVPHQRCLFPAAPDGQADPFFNINTPEDRVLAESLVLAER
ncbi:MAG: molybdenum cofactor guanylyltransferase [Magnetococcales bacterium]|nr:molybdenum cofactor guanylyltransferase [Magnetococcales bacterium]